MTPAATRTAVAEASGTVKGKAVKALDVVADRILSSFTPTPAWGANLRTILFQGIDTRLQMVGRTMSNIQRMQTDQALRELESSRQLGPATHRLAPQARFPETGQFRFEVRERTGQELADRERKRHGRSA